MNSICLLKTLVDLPEGLLFFTFWPTQSAIFVADQQKVKRKNKLCVLCVFSVAGGETNLCRMKR